MALYDSVISPGNGDGRILPQLIFFFPRGVPEPETAQKRRRLLASLCAVSASAMDSFCGYRSPICLSAKKRDCLPLFSRNWTKKISESWDGVESSAAVMSRCNCSCSCISIVNRGRFVPRRGDAQTRRVKRVDALER